MQRLARLVIFLALVASVAVPAGAAHGPGCEDSWRGTDRTRSCGFAVRGVPVVVSGRAYAGTGTARVTVTASILLPEGEHVVASCTDDGVGVASCSGEWSPLQEPVDPFVTSAPLVCRVSGTSTHPSIDGYYGCFSWQGDPHPGVLNSGCQRQLAFVGASPGALGTFLGDTPDCSPRVVVKDWSGRTSARTEGDHH